MLDRRECAENAGVVNQAVEPAIALIAGAAAVVAALIRLWT